MAKVSIIIPIYNAENYLSRAIESVQNQTLKDIEIILVNDGSTDGSLAICEEYRDKDKRIKLINIVNSGVAVARNRGIEIATGDYLGFVDADDYIDDSMYENMYKRIIGDSSDICVCNYILESKNSKQYIDININESILDNKEQVIDKIMIPLIGATKLLGEDVLLGFRGSVLYLYKRELIETYNIKFKTGLKIGEDFLFNLNYLQYANKASIDKGYYYYYYINETSATQRYRDDWWIIHKKLIEYVEKFLININLISRAKNRVDVMKINYLIGAIANEFRSENKKNKYDKFDTIEEIYDDILIKKAMDNINYSHLNIYRKIWFSCIKKRYLSILNIYYLIRNYKIIKVTKYN